MSNPLGNVWPANAQGDNTGSAITNLPSVSNYGWQRNDLSADGAGRLESGRMVKKRIGRATLLALEWKQLTYTEAALVLSTFGNNEYVNVNHLDVVQNSMVTKHFYVGDRSARRTPGLERWTDIQFNLIQATPDSG